MIRTQEKIYQWSTNVSVYVDSASQVQFAQVGSSETMNVEPQASGEVFVATIPNVLLQEAKDIFIYQGEESERVSIIYRAKPDDYVYTETEVKNYDALAARLDELQEQVDDIDVTAYELPIASSETLGGIKVGQNLTISPDGTLGAPYAEKGDAGAPGKDGASAAVYAGTTTTGEPGTQASVVNTGTAQAAVFNFTIPRGDKGEPGQDGTDGDDGYTPQRGVDYWTAADVQTIEDYVDEQIAAQGGGGGSYTLPPATSTTLGGIKVGANLSITEDGTLSAASSSGGGEEAGKFEQYLYKSSGYSGWGILSTDGEGNPLNAKALCVGSSSEATGVAYLRLIFTYTREDNDTQTIYFDTDASYAAVGAFINNGIPYVIGTKVGTGKADNGYAGDCRLVYANDIRQNTAPPATAFTQLSFDFYTEDGKKVNPTFTYGGVTAGSTYMRFSGVSA